jgi:hypothetical protein
MMPRPYHGLVTNEDRRTYRKWMLPIALAYGATALLMVVVAIRSHNYPSNRDAAGLDSGASVSITHHSNLDR